MTLVNEEFAHSPLFFAPVVTPQEMDVWDKESQKIGFPGIVLMEKAAHAAATLFMRLYPKCLKLPCAVLAGTGNNGGDAVCMGRILHEAGAQVTIYLTKAFEAYSDSCLTELTIARNLSIPFLPAERFAEAEPAILLDGFLGTGFRGQLREDALALIRMINSTKKRFTLAIDIPSGLDGRTGLPSPEAIKANATICMEAIKTGLLMPTATDYVGRLFSVPIGIPKFVKNQYRPHSYRIRAKLASLTPPMPENGHKGLYGHVAVIGGGVKQTCGAATLAARAAFRTGAGMVHAVAPEELVSEIRNGLPELMLCPLNNSTPSLWPHSVPENCQDLLSRCASLVVGPGMGTNDDALLFLEALLALETLPPIIFDADALTLFAQHPTLLARIREQDILTPHPGEAARLLGTSSRDIQEKRQEALSELCSRQKGIVILKGANTLIGQVNKPSLICPWDIPQLSIAGAGDVLCGILAGLSAERALWEENPPSMLFLAATGVAIHAMAAKKLTESTPSRGFLAQELADCIVQTREKEIAQIAPQP